MQQIKFGKYTIDHNGMSEESDWPERDKLPTGDPIGDVVDMTNGWVDMALSCAGRAPGTSGVDFSAIRSKGTELKKPCAEAIKNVYKSHYQRPDDKWMGDTCKRIVQNILITGSGFEKKCTCGTHAVHGKVPKNAHAPSCNLRN